MDIKKQVLPNGLRVLFYPMPGVRSTAILITVGVGSRYEVKHQIGICHLLEHMAFKGTSKRPSPKIIAEEVEGRGGILNAFTGKEETGYWIKIPSDYFAQAFEVLSDMILESLFAEAEVEREKEVVIEEITGRIDDPQSLVYDVYDELFYGDQPLGWNTAGTEEAVSAITPEALRAHKATWEKPGNMLISVAGNVPEEQVFSLAERYFGGLPSQPFGSFRPVVFSQSGPRVRVYPKDTKQAHLFLGVKSFPRRHPSYFPAEVLEGILGRGLSSRLFLEVRERRALAYAVVAVNRAHDDIGEFAVYAGVSPQKIEEALQAILGELAKIKTQFVEGPEIEKAKSYLTGTLSLRMEDTLVVAVNHADWQMRGEEKSVEEVSAAISKVTPKQIRDISKEIFIPQLLNLALVGPFKEEDEARFLEILGSFE